MRVAITGTPGTGKTTVSERLDTELEVVHLNERIRDQELTTGEDTERRSLIADLDAISETLADRTDLLVESHLAHHLDVDRVVVLRCHPRELKARLTERGEDGLTLDDESESTPAEREREASENAEAEALDVILSEAVEFHGLESVYEIDTTDRTPATVAADVMSVIEGDREPSAGTVAFIDYL